MLIRVTNDSKERLVFNGGEEVVAFDELKSFGNTAFNASRFGEAILCYRGALLVKPEEAVIYSNLSAAFMGLQRYNDAKASAGHCIRLNQLWPKGYYRLAVSLLALDDATSAHEAVMQASDLAPQDKQVEQLLAKVTLAL